MNIYFAIDIGGTTIKGGVVDEDNNLLCKSFVNTCPVPESNYLTESILELIKKLEDASGFKIADAAGLGIGAPGLIDCKNGIIGFSGNLKVRNYPLVENLKKHITIPIKLANDADVATLAEMFVGAGKPYNNFIMLTLGTGIGGGIIVGGKMLATSSPYGGEIGHIKVSDSGVKCTCGDKNCFEALASTKALVSLTKQAMQENPDSKMWSKYNLSNIDGRTIFEFLKTDKTAKEVFNQYIVNLGNGIVSLHNIFCPEAIIIGGAISNQKDVILPPLTKYVNNHIYVKNIDYKANIIPAELRGEAGILGAKCLFSERGE